MVRICPNNAQSKPPPGLIAQAVRSLPDPSDPTFAATFDHLCSAPIGNILPVEAKVCHHAQAEDAAITGVSTKPGTEKLGAVQCNRALHCRLPCTSTFPYKPAVRARTV